jgi:hypothetical protein
LPPRRDLARRFKRSGKEKLILLMLSDHDPEGVDIPHAFARSMRDDFGIGNVEAIKVALRHDQVTTLDMPTALDAKKSSSRYKKFAARYGDAAYELEAIPPQLLERLLTEAVDRVLDVEAFNAEVEAEKHDVAGLADKRRTAFEALTKTLPGLP